MIAQARILTENLSRIAAEEIPSFSKPLRL
jgi:hypothetical protein